MTNSSTPSPSTIARAYTRGPRATISRSIIAGQPRGLSTVHVISTDGDTLTYTTDGVWFSTATRNDITDWELLAPALPVYARGDAVQYCGIQWTVTDGNEPMPEWTGTNDPGEHLTVVSTYNGRAQYKTIPARDAIRTN
jgi:hypothetical protein